MFILDYYERRNSSDDEGAETGDIEAPEIDSHHPSRRNAHIPIARVGAHREFWQTIQLLPFAPEFQTAHTYMLAMRVLPPILRFREHITKLSQSNCSICLEEFKNGEFIQPFGVCVHEFHLYCVNSWLLNGNTTCPLCREELPISA